MGSSCVKAVLPFKILVIFFFGGRELSYDLFLIFFGYFFNGGNGFNHCHLFGRGIGRETGREWGRVRKDGVAGSHVTFLLASETASFFEAFLSFLCSKLPWLLFGINVHFIGISGGSTSGRGGVMGGDGGAGGVLFCDSSRKALLAKELVDLFIPSLRHGWDYFHTIDLF